MEVRKNWGNTQRRFKKRTKIPLRLGVKNHKQQKSSRRETVFSGCLAYINVPSDKVPPGKEGGG